MGFRLVFSNDETRQHGEYIDFGHTHYWILWLIAVWIKHSDRDWEMAAIQRIETGDPAHPHMFYLPCYRYEEY